MNCNISFRQEKFQDFSEICSSRKHKIIKGEYINAHSPVTIYCEIHDTTFDTTFHKYKKSTHGLACCGKQAVRDFAKKATRDSKGKFLKS